jgi:hypothetical protein
MKLRFRATAEATGVYGVGRIGSGNGLRRQSYGHTPADGASTPDLGAVPPQKNGIPTPIRTPSLAPSFSTLT